MRYLSGKDEEEAMKFIDSAAEVARHSTCLRSRCGSIVVKDNKIIGKGFNSPPGGKESQRRCLNKKDEYDRKVTDKTCCVHAEQRAIMDTIKNDPETIQNAGTLYFIRLDSQGNKEIAKTPYCTVCSKMAFDAGISEFVLLHEKGICIYNTEEYNDLSFNFSK